MIVARTVLPNGYVVSTIWRDSIGLEIDRLLGLISEIFEYERGIAMKGSEDYESMVFRCDQDGEITDFTELDFRRYNTEEEARAGHQEMVEKWRTK